MKRVHAASFLSFDKDVEMLDVSSIRSRPRPCFTPLSLDPSFFQTPEVEVFDLTKTPVLDASSPFELHEIDLTLSPVSSSSSSSWSTPKRSKPSLAQLPTDLIGVMTSFLNVQERVSLFSTCSALKRDMVKFYQTKASDQPIHQGVGMFPLQPISLEKSPFAKHAAGLSIHLNDPVQQSLLTQPEVISYFKYVNKLVFLVSQPDAIETSFHHPEIAFSLCSLLRLPTLKHLVFRVDPTSFVSRLTVPSFMLDGLSDNQLESFEVDNSFNYISVACWPTLVHRQRQLKKLAVSCADLVRGFHSFPLETRCFPKLESCFFRFETCEDFVFPFRPRQLRVIMPDKAPIHALHIPPFVQAEFLMLHSFSTFQAPLYSFSFFQKLQHKSHPSRLSLLPFSSWSLTCFLSSNAWTIFSQDPQTDTFHCFEDTSLQNVPKSLL